MPMRDMSAMQVDLGLGGFGRDDGAGQSAWPVFEALRVVDGESLLQAGGHHQVFRYPIEVA